VTVRDRVAGERVAVTGASGRAGSALVAELRRGGAEVFAWTRPDYDLDDPSSAARMVSRDMPTRVIHAAAWTDVDGCARDPALAIRRNAEATIELAHACTTGNAELVFISTNEVFSGDRGDGRGYVEEDETAPPNSYGRSKLLGEQGIREVLGDGTGRAAWIVRTSWLFGPPGNDFPARIVSAADGRATPRIDVVVDEMGRPTRASDLAAALIALVGTAPPDTYHLANEGVASRFDWARAVLGRCRPSVKVEPIYLADYERASTPPRWGVLDTRRAARVGVTLRDWREALDAYLDDVCPEP
jgi:dTDP-4-dehydrorhamnose reductase